MRRTPFGSQISIDAQGRQAPLTVQVVALRVKRRALLAGLDPAQFSGHSLRWASSPAPPRHGACIWKLADQSRHRSMDTLRGYVRDVRDGQLFEDHAGEAFL